jgi:N-acetylglutamate synthase-like GNAT family acetyltransferase
MSSRKYSIRRATLDDMGQLTALWQSMNFPVEDLAKRLTEFQVAHDAEGHVFGAVGLQLAQRQGLIHSEGFTDFGLSDHLRPLIWERLQSIAANHGLVRLWTQEAAPFWGRCGLHKPDEEASGKLPPIWRERPGAWLTLKLKEEVEEVISAEKEFALFMESEKQRSHRALQQARVLKVVATVIALGLFLLIGAALFILVRKNPQLIPH